MPPPLGVVVGAHRCCRTAVFFCCSSPPRLLSSSTTDSRRRQPGQSPLPSTATPLSSVVTHMLPVPKSIMALALTLSLVKAAAFYCSCSRGASSHIILRNGSTSAVSNNTASVNEYELLKKLPPFCIHARLTPTYGKRDGIKGSSEATKIVHFQRHAQGTLFGQFTFCFQFGSFITSKSQRRALGKKERTMQFAKSGRTKQATSQDQQIDLAD